MRLSRLRRFIIFRVSKLGPLEANARTGVSRYIPDDLLFTLNIIQVISPCASSFKIKKNNNKKYSPSFSQSHI